jgi:hypothetical protein
MVRRRGLGPWLLSLTLTVGGARAQGPGHDQAEALLNEGIADYQAGKFVEAAAALEKAYALEHAPRILFNIARAYDKAGDAPSATRAYERYLASGTTEPDLAAKSRDALERLRAASPPPPSPAPVIKSPPPPAGPISTPPPQPSEPAPAPSHTLAWVLMGTGAVALGVGAGIGVWASRTAQNEKASTDPTQKPSLRDAAYTRAIVGDVTMAAGMVLFGTGLVLRITSRSPSAGTVGHSAFLPGALRLGPMGAAAEWAIDP